MPGSKLQKEHESESEQRKAINGFESQMTDAETSTIITWPVCAL